MFSAERWDCRSREDLVECAAPCHDAQVVGLYRVSSPVYLTVMAAKSDDYTTVPRQLHITKVSLAYRYGRDKVHLVGDTSKLSCEPQGIPQKGLHIACEVMIYFNDVILTLA